MASMPDMSLDIAVPTGVNQAARRVQRAAPDFNKKLVLAVVAGALFGPFGLAAAFILYSGMDILG